MLTDGLAQKRLQISGWFVGEDRDTPYDGSEKTPNPLQERTRVRVYLITGDLRLTRMAGVQVTVSVPDVTRSAVVQRTSGPFYFSENFRGTGDTSAVFWRRFVTSTGWNATFNGGVSLPTGKTEAPRFRPELDDGSLVPMSRLQRGTGTFDPLIGASLNRVVASVFPPGIRVFVSGAARLPMAENDHGLRTGASWEAGAGASREIKWETIVAIGRLSWLHREQDAFNGTPVLVGGGDWIAIAPSLAVTLKDVTIQMEVRLPLYRSLDNRQLDSARTFQAGLVWVLR